MLVMKYCDTVTLYRLVNEDGNCTVPWGMGQRAISRDGKHLLVPLSQMTEENGALRCKVYVKCKDSDEPSIFVLDVMLDEFNFLPDAGS